MFALLMEKLQWAEDPLAERRRIIALLSGDEAVAAAAADPLGAARAEVEKMRAEMTGGTEPSSESVSDTPILMSLGETAEMPVGAPQPVPVRDLAAEAYIANMLAQRGSTDTDSGWQ